MTITIERLHEDLLGIKKELKQLRFLVEEDYEIADDVIKDIEESKSRSREDMVSHEDMKKEFG